MSGGVHFTVGDVFALNGDTPEDDPVALIVFGAQWPEVRRLMREKKAPEERTIVAIDRCADVLTRPDDDKGEP